MPSLVTIEREREYSFSGRGKKTGQHLGKMDKAHDRKKKKILENSQFINNVNDHMLCLNYVQRKM